MSRILNLKHGSRENAHARRGGLNRTRRGDTLIEVAFSVAVFGFISALSIGIMNRNLNFIQSTLEITMARNEIDSQAEAIRFIHNAYTVEREMSNQGSDTRPYQKLWFLLSRGTATSSLASEASKGLANNPAKISDYKNLNCSAYYQTSGSDSIFSDHAFVINTRKIDPNSPNSTIVRADTRFREGGLYPRIIFKSNTSTLSDNTNSSDSDATNITSVENIWVVAARDVTTVPETEYNSGAISDSDLEKYVAQYFDFHIRTCWYSPGRNTPVMISTIIRLYNPEYIEGARD